MARANLSFASSPPSFCACASVGVRMPLLERTSAMLKAETEAF